MPGAVEEEQERVAAPLEQPRSPVVRLVEQRPEDAVECVPHQLRADLPLTREQLRERCEPRDIDERERAFDREVASLRVVPGPLDQQPRHIRLQHLGLTLEDGKLDEQGHRLSLPIPPVVVTAASRDDAAQCTFA